MATLIYSYVIFMLVIGFSLSTRCPTTQNDRVNITRTVKSLSIVWKKNDATLISAEFDKCNSPLANEDYTNYCEAGGKFTLEVHHPVEGDRYSESIQLNNITTIIFQEPETIRFVIAPSLNTNITLADDDTYTLTTTINCTKPTPVLKWIVRAGNGITRAYTGESTTDKTGCDVKQTTITSRMTISKQTVDLFNQPFQVLSQLSYTVCDNIHTSLPGKYFTITEPPTVTILANDQISDVVEEGYDVMFNCSVVSFLPPSLTWTRSQQGGQLSSGAQYNLTNATCQHTDNYTCSANKVLSGSVPLYVRCSPRAISPTPRRLTNKVGAVATLPVDIIAYPAPTFTWYYTGTDQRLTTAVTEQLTINKYKSTLTITLNASLFGDYVVSVVNDVGEVNFTFTVKEGDSPTTPRPTTLEPTEDNIIPIVVGVVVVVIVIIIVIIIIIVVYVKRNKGTKEADMPINLAQRQDGPSDIAGAPATGILGSGENTGSTPTNTSNPQTPETIEKESNGTTNNKPTQSQEPVLTPQGLEYAQVTKKQPASSKKQEPVLTTRGLNYTHVDFTKNQPADSEKPAKPKVERVEYAEIQYGVTGIPSPDVDDDDEDDDE